jgi:hypothetical protein
MRATPRRLAVLAVGVAALAGVHSATAAADTISQTYTVPGTYDLAIPRYTTSVNVIANGAGGADGGGGAAGGLGAEVNATIPVAPGTKFAPGDALKIIVGARAGGGSGGNGDELGAGGGNGGGAAVVADTSGATTVGLAVAGGGGGGGGNGGIDGAAGGAGGQGPGSQANGSGGVGTGRGGGGMGDNECTDVSRGGTGGAAAIATDAGGGGGGGDGACGGGGGSAGGAGGGGGGGGGAGASFYATSGVGTIGTTGTNHDATVVLHFTRSDVAPHITSAASTTVAQSAGTVHFVATADGAPDSQFSLSGAPAWLAIDPSTGVLSGTIPPRTAGAFGLTITADNGVAPAATQAFTLTVTDPALALTPPKPLQAVTGLPFSTALHASGGSAPYTWSVASGSLPPGLALLSDGTIAGTPTQAGSTTFTARATDSAAPSRTSATEPVTVTVAARTLTVSTASLPDAQIGKGYSQPLTAAMNVGRVTWSLAGGALPPGLVLFPTGTIAGTPTAAGTSSFKLQATDSTTPTPMRATAQLSIAVRPAVEPAVYVVNGANSAVHSYALGASGNVSPLTTLTGPATGLNGTSAVTLAADGRTYVASANDSSIREYRYGATGNVAPDSVIAGADTGLASPQALVLDGQGRLYVADGVANSITVYAPGASGDARPVATLHGPDTGLRSPSAVTIDGRGNLWVANQAANSLTEYPAAPNGDVAPLATIAGFATRLNGPQGLALDSAGLLVVADTYDNSITEYQPTANGNVLPIRRIAGDATGLSFPIGVDVDAAGNLYVSNQFGGVEEFLFPANGNRTPLATIAGSATGLSSPGRLAVAPPLSVRTKRLPRARTHHRYTTRLRAQLGTTPYHWTVTRGHLPRGLRLRHGRIAGRPDQHGTYRFTVRVKDASHPVMRASRRLRITVR